MRQGGPGCSGPRRPKVAPSSTAPCLPPQALQTIRGEQVAAARPLPVACSAASVVLRHFGTVGSGLVACESQAKMLNGLTGGGNSTLERQQGLRGSVRLRWSWMAYRLEADDRGVRSTTKVRPPS
ncbi:hypothetical protein NDU88_002015 [Pleurodeles waltl]|uniref:Uncharacterized protein n=1 Tax=Pleurodeles waltl TaxID=8319 RepID=A0AAV7TJG5_PLEWA|nr:hypothetical protein NDU88_002015 [Pleurodeles waltl]